MFFCIVASHLYFSENITSGFPYKKLRLKKFNFFVKNTKLSDFLIQLNPPITKHTIDDRFFYIFWSLLIRNFLTSLFFEIIKHLKVLVRNS